jgi:hypothetical protein
MASFHNFERVYSPDSLKIMTTAFDYAHKSLPAKFQGNDAQGASWRCSFCATSNVASTIPNVSLPRPCWTSCDDRVRDGIPFQN